MADPPLEHEEAAPITEDIGQTHSTQTAKNTDPAPATPTLPSSPASVPVDASTDHERRASITSSLAEKEEEQHQRSKWTLGVLSDKQTDEVPGSVLLLSKDYKHNAPLGMRHAPRRSSSSSLPSPYPPELQSPAMFRRVQSPQQEKKRTTNGKIILEPQPEDSANDPLNWSTLRRDVALLSLGLYCMVGGGMTPILAAGFSNVAKTYDVSVPRVALTTGLYMMGLGLGSVVWSPTAIQFGKRPVYLGTVIVFILTAVWGALSPSFACLVVARVVQGFAVAPVECLPSATIAEIFFLHERAYRLGIYTLLLLGGKNLIPLISAVIIQALDWQWVFWIVAMVVGFCGVLLFFFVPETFWDRTPRPHVRQHRTRPSLASLRRFSSHYSQRHAARENTAISTGSNVDADVITPAERIPSPTLARSMSPTALSLQTTRQRHAHFAEMRIDENSSTNVNSPLGTIDLEKQPPQEIDASATMPTQSEDTSRTTKDKDNDAEHRVEEYDRDLPTPLSPEISGPAPHPYTAYYRDAPPKTYFDTLRVYSGRMSREPWWKIAARPFVLYTYPAVLWSAAVYACSVGWLIVLSESVTTIYRSKDTYDFTALQSGLIYISPFIGGILGTAVAGKVSDYIVLYMARRNGGIYEPEFRLVMGIPVALATTVGLMGYGWSAQVHDSYWVPTIFFGIISFGCTLGSTTAITFTVDSYRQYAGEALVTLNFSKNIFHGLVFSLFFNSWLDDEGSKDVFLVLGGIQLAVLLFTIPLYIYGKRARMWTVRTNFMDKLLG